MGIFKDRYRKYPKYLILFFSKLVSNLGKAKYKELPEENWTVN